MWKISYLKASILLHFESVLNKWSWFTGGKHLTDGNVTRAHVRMEIINHRWRDQSNRLCCLHQTPLKVHVGSKSLVNTHTKLRLTYGGGDCDDCDEWKNAQMIMFSTPNYLFTKCFHEPFVMKPPPSEVQKPPFYGFRMWNLRKQWEGTHTSNIQ